MGLTTILGETART